MSKRKILFAIPDFSGGGAERVFLNIIKNISRHTFEVHLLVGKLEGQYCKYLPGDICVHQVGSFKSVDSVLFILKVVWSIRPEVVFSTLGYVVSVSLASSLFPKNTKCIARFGNTLSPYLQEFKEVSFIRYLYQYLINKSVFYFSDNVIVQSEHMKADIVSLFKLKSKHINKIIKINNPVDIKNIRLSALLPLNGRVIFNDNFINFVSVGRLDKQKGYETLIKSFSIVNNKFKSTMLFIIGQGELEHSLQELINSLNLNKKVILLGFVSNPYQIMSKMDFFVSASLYEGVSNAMLESLALGVPVIATDCPSGVREVILEGENGFLSSLDGDVSKNMSNIMIAILANNPKIELLVDVERFYEKYDISRVIKIYDHFLK